MAASWQPGESARIELDERVRIEFLTPATAAGELEDRIKRAKTRGVVALAYGLGGQRSEVWDALKASGAAVLLKTQCPFGETNPDKYLVGEGARSFMNARTMTIEACFSKLMWSLANFGDSEVRHVIETDIAGEF